TGSASALAIVFLAATVPQWKVLPATAAASAPQATATITEPIGGMTSFKAQITPAATPVTNTAKTNSTRTAVRSEAASTAKNDLPESFKVSFEPAPRTVVAPTQTNRFPGWRAALTAFWIFGMICCLG